MGLSRVARWAIVGIATVTLVIAIVVSLWATRERYAPLFTDLSDSEAASVVAQLKRLKVSYRLDDGGATVRVPEDKVHEARLELVSSGAPIGGVVGFELFDKQGLGTTEQSQHVSYQRALQGELARTIGALNGVKQARVHLVLPETALFRRERSEPRAAVSLTMKKDSTLTASQVSGIQRLVAASVQNLEPARVVVSDQQGVVLSQTDITGRGIGATDAQLALQRNIEEYLTQKTAALLDRSLGPGSALVSVNVSLNFDEVTRTDQEVIPSREGHSVVRLTQQSRVTQPTDGTAIFGDASGTNSQSRDVQYEYGRRVEQVVAAPGAISRLTVGVVLPRRVEAAVQDQVKQLVQAAIGFDAARGDSIVVHTLDALPTASGTVDAARPDAASTVPQAAPEQLSHRQTITWVSWQWWMVILIAAAMSMLAIVALRHRTRRRLSESERDELLREVRSLLQSERQEGLTP